MSALLDSLLAERAPSDAVESLRRDGLPTTRDEAWKYTSLRALERRTFASGDALAATRLVDSHLLDLAIQSSARLVFVNGAFRADLSNTENVDGIEVHAGGARNDESRATDRAAAFERLNATLATDGAHIRVAAGISLAAPIHLVYVGAQAEHDIAWHARTRIDIGEGARLTLIEHHLAASPNAHLGNVSTRYSLAPRAALDLVQIQDAASTSTLIRRSEFDLADDAHLSTHALEIGGELSRHDIVVALRGRGARYDGRGVLAVRDRQHTDVELAVTHGARDTACDLNWRGIADGRGRGVFLGAITVAAGADGADARLSNKNLLLSANAEIDTRPVLEIHADEVKASHGATVGQLDERALFYMRSRGLDATSARRLLTIAFCREILDANPIEALREPIAATLLSRLSLGVEST